MTWCIREDLQTITDWFKANKLTLNLDKSVCILFSKNKLADKNKYLNELNLPIADHTKFLGLRLDKILNWTYQFNHVTLKLKRNMTMLRRSVKLMTSHAKKTLYYGHIYSHLSYCISTWGPMLQQNQIKKLQKLQNKCINLIDLRKADLNKKFKMNKILRVEEIIELELAKIGFRLINKQLPKKILDTLSTDHNEKNLQKIHLYNTRQKNLQNLPKVKNSKYLSSFLCKSIKAIQPLLFITKNVDNLRVFVSKYKKHIFVPGHNK